MLANSFWKCWVSEYLPTLQLRQKWRKGARNVEVSVEKVFPDEHGTVRQVIVRTNNGKFKRDIRKLCTLEETKIDGDR